MDIYKSVDLFAVRHATIPWEFLEAYAAHKDRSAFLIDYYERNETFRKAIAIASPKLAKQLQKKPVSKEAVAGLQKYFIRGASRTTPFGLFASIGLGSFSQNFNPVFSLSRIEASARPDSSWYAALMASLEENPKLLAHLRVAINPSLIHKGSRIYLFQSSESNEDIALVTLTKNRLIDCVIENSARPILFSHLVSRVCSDCDLENKKEEITGKLALLLKQKILLSELSLRPEDPQETKLSFDALSPLIKDEKTREACALAKNCSIDDAAKLDDHFKVDYPIQVDSFSHEKESLPHAIRSVLEETASRLIALSLRKQAKESARLEKIHRDFLEKFGVDTLVPLNKAVEVLDFSQLDTKNKEEAPAFFEELLVKSSVQDEIYIDPNDASLQLTEEERQKAPLSAELFFEMIKGKDEYTIVLNPFLTSNQMFNSLGRFIHLFKPKVANDLREMFTEEASLDAEKAFVEASFLPINARTHNVARFTPVRKYHLPFGYHDGSPNTISPDDIYIGANLDGLYSFSKSLGKKLHVSISSAVNPDLAPLPLRVLLEITQAAYGFFTPFDWGALRKSARLPRIRYKNVILSPKRWFIAYTEEKKPVESCLKRQIDALEIPKNIQLCQFDHRLTLDWTVPEQFAILVQHLQKEKELIIVESFTDTSTLPFSSEKGRHVTEIALSLVRSFSAKKSKTNPPLTFYQESPQKQVTPQRKFCYLKMYLSQDQIASFIEEKIVPFTTKHSENGLISKWFYIRYIDTGPHLRLRLFQSDLDTEQSVLEEGLALASDALKEGTITHYCMEPYDREIERYGGVALIDDMESFFCVDSTICLQLLTLHTQEDDPLWVYAALSILSIAKEFYPERDALLRFLKARTGALSLDGTRAEAKKWLPAAHHIFAPGAATQTPLLNAMGILSHYSALLQKDIDNVILSEEKKLEICDSLLHMHCNRLMGTDHALEKKARSFAFLLLKKSRAYAHA